VTVRGEPHALGVLLLEKEPRSAHSMGGWVSHIAVLDFSEKRLFP